MNEIKTNETNEKNVTDKTKLIEYKSEMNNVNKLVLRNFKKIVTKNQDNEKIKNIMDDIARICLEFNKNEF